MRQHANAKSAYRPQPRRTHAGFTLIEVLIVVALIGILGAIGFPSYADYVESSRRADAHLALLNGTQDMERCRSTQFAYTNCDIAAAESEQQYYDVEVSSVTATSFTITATAKGAQAGDTDCATMSIDDLGQRLPATGCWK